MLNVYADLRGGTTSAGGQKRAPGKGPFTRRLLANGTDAKLYSDGGGHGTSVLSGLFLCLQKLTVSGGFSSLRESGSRSRHMTQLPPKKA